MEKDRQGVSMIKSIKDNIESGLWDMGQSDIIIVIWTMGKIWTLKSEACHVEEWENILQSYALLEGTNKKSMNNIKGRQYTLRNRVDKQEK